MNATITYQVGTYYGEAEQMHTWTIADEDGTAAELYIERTANMIMSVEVREDRRGEGLARALYEAAEAQLGTIYHVPAWGRTPEGDAFADAMGGETLDDETAAAITGFDLSAIA